MAVKARVLCHRARLHVPCSSRFRPLLITNVGHDQQRDFQTAVPPKTPGIRIVEVGPRDGLSNIRSGIDANIKIDLIRRLADTGLQSIEATAFAGTQWRPQSPDGEQVMEAVLTMQSRRRFNSPAVAPDIEGLRRAAKIGAREALVVASASEGSSWKTSSCSIENALKHAEETAAACLKHVVSCIFTCPYDGPTQHSRVLDIAKRVLEMGCYEVQLSETMGVGTTADIEKLLKVLLSEIPANRIAGHFHDTYGQAVANVYKSYEMGLRAFDGSVAGLDGYVYAGDAGSNAATEDLVYAFERAGVATGIDLPKLAGVGAWITKQLGINNSSRVGAALVAKERTSRHATVQSNRTGADFSLQPNWKIITDDGEHRVARSGSMVKVTLTRPGNGNALTNSMVESITKLYRELAEDSTVFHIILAAEGRFFCTGMDLSSSGSSSSNDPKAKAQYYNKVEAFFNAVQDSPQTTIAVTDQPCYGGGVGLAFSCDVRLCSQAATFTLTEVKLGLSPAIISRQVIREWGFALAREAMLSGRTVEPSQLLNIGAVHGLAHDHADLEDMASSYLAKLGTSAPRSATATTHLTRLAWKEPGGKGQDRYIAELFEEMMVPGSEGEHGMAQFRKKIKETNWQEFHAGSYPGSQP